MRFQLVVQTHHNSETVKNYIYGDTTWGLALEDVPIEDFGKDMYISVKKSPLI
ncbi:MAG: hypothetical protein WA997_19200 [Anaerolineales bacterium]